MPKIYDLTVPDGTYTDASTGEEKTRWINCGALIEKSNGKRAVKLNVIPVNFEGWLECVTPTPRGEKKRDVPPAPSSGDFDDDIPDF